MSSAPTPTPPTSADYRVQLEAYAGPLDLLMFLVKRHEIDLHDIPMAELTEQYMAHLRAMQTLQPYLDVDRVGEFLVMAATLVEIKSQMLIPRPEGEGGGEGEDPTDAIDDPTDPRYELVQQLLAYKRFKDAANALEARAEQWSGRFGVRAAMGEVKEQGPDNAPPADLDLEDVQVLDLCRAFGRIIESIGDRPRRGAHEVTYDDTPISLHAEDIKDRLRREGPMTLRAIFVGRASRSEMIGLFLATLELVRQKAVRVVQEGGTGGDIRLEPLTEAEQAEQREDAAVDWRDPGTGEMQYDYPDEASRRRAERRANIRSARSAQRDFDDLTEEEKAELAADEDDQHFLDERQREDDAVGEDEDWDDLEEEGD